MPNYNGVVTVMTCTDIMMGLVQHSVAYVGLKCNSDS